ncbi:MAG: ornithine cyclodeaminase family protein [Tardiphaga sp.]|uniref:ornithine cyclodeaminase family protein n=1 Tax=Tardiphaga sp. TaxID=1926292 RepID=UPI0019B255A4|nr:ornithine cyclodeaminase family protein [Tardiphaga sp.]MBC7584771.1 ornithine cyclodeaminase family protein [Tardiphaga sp.]
MAMPLFLDEAAIAPLIDMADAVDCLEQAFKRWRDPGVVNMVRSRARPPQGVLNLMGAVDGPAGVYGFKSYFAVSASVRFHIALHSAADGRLLVLMESSLFSQVRTGAASGLATKLLARPAASTLALIGTGRQATAQAEAVCAVRPIKRVNVSGRDPARAAAFAERLRRLLQIDVVVASDARTAVEDADVVGTITRSSTPVIALSWLKPGAHVNAAGANTSDRREIDPATLKRAAVLVTDDRAQARIEAAELMDLHAAGELSWDDVVELGDLVSSPVCFTRRSADDVTVFKSLGIAFEDVAYANHLYLRGLAAGLWRAEDFRTT